MIFAQCVKHRLVQQQRYPLRTQRHCYLFHLIPGCQHSRYQPAMRNIHYNGGAIPMEDADLCVNRTSQGTTFRTGRLGLIGVHDMPQIKYIFDVAM